jgi:hypothetical protein
MKTAVEWFEDGLTLFYDDAYIQRLLKEAKEMEKKQIVKAYNESFLLRDKPYATAEKYYNETFKQSNSPEIPASSKQQEQ